MAMLVCGRPIPVPPVEQALRFLESQGEPSTAAAAWPTGTPEWSRARLETIAAEYGADEVIVVTITLLDAARRRSYELLAEAFELARASGGPRDPRVAD